MDVSHLKLCRTTPRIAALLVTLGCPALAAAQENALPPQRAIREISNTAEPIYPEETTARSSFKAFVVRNHPPTREWVVRNELLFKEGDILDKDLLVASERSSSWTGSSTRGFQDIHWR